MSSLPLTRIAPSGLKCTVLTQPAQQADVSEWRASGEQRAALVCAQRWPARPAGQSCTRPGAPDARCMLCPAPKWPSSDFSSLSRFTRPLLQPRREGTACWGRPTPSCASRRTLSISGCQFNAQTLRSVTSPCSAAAAFPMPAYTGVPLHGKRQIPNMQGASGTAGGQQDAAVPAAEQLVAALRANGELERLRSLALEKLEKDVGCEGRGGPGCLASLPPPSPPLLPPLIGCPTVANRLPCDLPALARRTYCAE